MRILKPEVAKERKEKILRWVVQQFVENRRPIGSQLLADSALKDISSATIRNIMKDLEEEGYLYQPHTSGGRIPTDKAYRYYVDYLTGMQRMAAQERERIEKQYDERVGELDNVMLHTSRLLARLSGAAGFVYTANVEEQEVKRLDFLPLGSGMLLAVLVMQSGQVRHWPVKLGYDLPPAKLRMLSNFINAEIKGMTLKEAQDFLWQYIQTGHREVADVADVAVQILKDMQKPRATAEELYIEGLGRMLENTEQSDYEDIKQMMRVVEERQRLSELLSEKMNDLRRSGKEVAVSIGSENEIKELQNVSIVSSAYRVGDKTVGMVGIIGPKHMQYTKVMSLVKFMGDLLEGSMSAWNALPGKDEEYE